MSWSRAHRWLAVVLVVPLAVWSVTGLLFHWKPGWGRAYDLLAVEQSGPLDVHALAPITAAGAGGRAVERVELVATVLGPLYRVRTADGTHLLDARTGRLRSPLSADDARALVADAIARSPHAAAYGAIGTVTVDGARARVTLAHDIVVDVDRHAARLRQHGADTERIDWLYRLHYLQWTGSRAVDRVLSVVGLALIWAVVVAGLVLFVRGRSRRAA